MITYDKLTEIKKETKRFLSRIDEWYAADKANPAGMNPKQNGALRRAGLDLSRALAEMRKP